jgi:hypothetical protein
MAGIQHADIDHTGLTGVGGGSGLISVDFALKTSGNTTLASATQANVDTGLDLVLTAAAGDIAVVSVNGLMGAANSALNFDVATIVAAAPVNYFGGGLASTNQGLLAWSKQNGAEFEPWSGDVWYELQGGDISGGTVTLRLVYKASASTILYSSATTRFWWGARIERPA